MLSTTVSMLVYRVLISHGELKTLCPIYLPGTFFKKYLSRAVNFTVIQEALNMEKKALKRFVSNCWLSVGPVCEWIIENWAGLTKYFLKTEHSAAIKESSMYKRIATSLQEGNIMLARLHFIVSIANLFKPFLTKFQSESVSIHLLFVTLFISTVEHVSLQCRSGSMQREGKS